MDTQINQRDWAQKYRPLRLEDMILPDSTMRSLIKLRDAEQGLSLLFHGQPGTGKTTAARLMYINTYEQNCSQQRGVDSIKQLVRIGTTPSIEHKFRVIIMDEADGLTSEAQDSLRHTIEYLSFGNMFVFTANDPDKLSNALHSRLQPVNFDFNKGDLTLRRRMEKRAHEVLENENISPEVSRVRNIVAECFPDMRRILKRMQFELTPA